MDAKPFYDSVTVQKNIKPLPLSFTYAWQDDNQDRSSSLWNARQKVANLCVLCVLLLSATSNMNVQSVLISTASSMDVQGVIPSTAT